VDRVIGGAIWLRLAVRPNSAGQLVCYDRNQADDDVVVVVP
jgi:hypothetical protein